MSFRPSFGSFGSKRSIRSSGVPADWRDTDLFGLPPARAAIAGLHSAGPYDLTGLCWLLQGRESSR